MSTKTKPRVWHWPKSAPVLTAKDICRGVYSGPGGRHCLRGWARTMLAGQWKVTKSLDEVLGASSIIGFNDDPKNEKSAIANVWNRAIKSLGYTRRGNLFVRRSK